MGGNVAATASSSGMVNGEWRMIAVVDGEGMKDDDGR